MKLLRGFSIALFAGALIMCGGRCSKDVAGGGGTETGNPAVVACAQASFDALDAGDGWCPLAYVPGGQSRLDPQSISFTAPSYTLAKRRYRPAYEAAIQVFTIVADTMIFFDTLVRRDTIYKPETTFVNDTLIREKLLSSRLDSTSINDTSTITTTIKVKDTIIVVDTLYAADTIIIPDTTIYRDTLFPGDTLLPYQTTVTVDTSAGVSHQDVRLVLMAAPSYTGISYADSQLVYDFISAESKSFNIPVAATNQKSMSLSAVAEIQKRYATTTGITITERYADRDGDGLLLSASAGTIPQIAYLVEAENGHRIERTVTDFDAGITGSITNSNETHIRHLFRVSTAPESLQTILYAKDTLGFSGTDSSLVKSSYYNRSEVESLTVAYALALGPNAVSWKDDHVKTITIRKIFRTGDVASVEIVMNINPAVSGGLSPSASCSAVIRMTDGTRAVIENGFIDLGTGWFSGTLTDKEAVKKSIRLERGQLR